MSKEEARMKIIEAMENGGIYCNNIVGAILRKHANASSIKEADALLLEMGLDKSLGITPVGAKSDD